MMREIDTREGMLQGTGRRFGLVAARFNQRIVERLIEGAVDTLVRHGVAATDLTLVRVPGAWEIPTALAELAAGGGYAALVALGAVVRGETPHFDYLCSQCSAGIAAVARDHRLPIGFGVLTCDTSEQAEERAGGKAGNKGAEAALAALEMADLIARLRTG